MPQGPTDGPDHHHRPFLLYDGQPLPMMSVAALRRRFELWVRGHRRTAAVTAVLLGLAIGYPFWAGALAARVVASQLSGRLGAPVQVARGRAGLSGIAFEGLVVGGERPLVQIERLEIPFAAAW